MAPIAILTQSMPPVPCGIGDHTQRIASALADYWPEVLIFARAGESHDRIFINGEAEPCAWFEWVQSQAELHGTAYVILQYTPLLFSKGAMQADLSVFRGWRALSRQFRTAVILHETYFRTWRYPSSLIRGTLQKAILRKLLAGSNHFFTASYPLRAEIETWGLRGSAVTLPIGSNVPLAECDRSGLRASYGVSTSDKVVTVFGGGLGVKWMATAINEVDRALRDTRIPFRWLFLGNANPTWFELKGQIIAPGWLTEANLSQHLSMTDIFLAPYYSGLCAKRGTVIAALQHSLPIVGTDGHMTEPYWRDLPGIDLVDVADAQGFAQAVTAACRSPELEERGRSNMAFFEAQFTWPHIGRRIIEAIDRPFV